MNYILMDIKKFLKKLETGQMEIEAGQWELHKDITNLKNTMQEFKQLKKDLHVVKHHGLRQTDLIKQLQTKLKGISDNDNWSFSSSSMFENDSFAPVTKVNKKVDTHSKMVLRSGKTLECKSQESVIKRQSVMELRPKKESALCASRETRQKVLDDSSHSFGRKTQNVSKKLPKISSPNHNILQRYLQDSTRYIEKEMPRMSCITPKKSSRSLTSDTVEQNYRNNCDPLKSNFDQQKQAKAEICGKNKKALAAPEKFHCSRCPEKFACKNRFLRLGKHQKFRTLYSCKVCNKRFFCKNLLKKHEKVHQKMTKCFRGYRCSYCDKICRSPEKLTAHLKSCRIITKANKKMI